MLLLAMRKLLNLSPPPYIHPESGTDNGNDFIGLLCDQSLLGKVWVVLLHGYEWYAPLSENVLALKINHKTPWARVLISVQYLEVSGTWRHITIQVPPWYKHLIGFPLGGGTTAVLWLTSTVTLAGSPVLTPRPPTSQSHSFSMPRSSTCSFSNWKYPSLPLPTYITCPVGISTNVKLSRKPGFKIYFDFPASTWFQPPASWRFVPQ